LGIYHPASNAGDDTASAPARGSQKHGTYYLYNNWDFNAVGAIFEKETWHDIYDALESDLAKPIGMQDFDRATHKKSGDLSRSMHPAYHMHLPTRDMARVGYLMLREGNWAGKQLVPRNWVREITKAQTPVTEMNPPRRRDAISRSALSDCERLPRAMSVTPHRIPESPKSPPVFWPRSCPATFIGR
jgi:CubicO group peptidase (beta-lactamase class C family)